MGRAVAVAPEAACGLMAGSLSQALRSVTIRRGGAGTPESPTTAEVAPVEPQQGSGSVELRRSELALSQVTAPGAVASPVWGDLEVMPADFIAAQC